MSIALALSGCATSLSEVSSGPTGCAPSEITIYAENVGPYTNTWMASCGGEDYRCSGAGRETVIPFLFDVVGATCTRVKRHTRRGAPRTAPPLVTEGRFDGKDDADHRTLTSSFQDGELFFLLYGVPAVSPRAVAFYIEVPSTLAGRSCDVALTINGEPAEPPPKARWENPTA